MARERSSDPGKGKREVDQVRQIAYAKSASVNVVTSANGKHRVTIAQFGVEPENIEFRGMLHSIEFVLRAQFDRGQQMQSMTQFTLRSKLADVIVHCVK
jgi:hypothetical protein